MTIPLRPLTAEAAAPVSLAEAESFRLRAAAARPARTDHYQPQLDGLRAVAIILVLLFHAEPFGPFSGGFIGVDIFFVLSAYLITGILAREWDSTGNIRLGLFYLKRGLRLFPALLLMLAAYVCVAPFLWPDTNPARDALLAVLYLTDYSFPIWQAPYYLRHTWSLAVEEHFYLLWPLLLPLLIKTRRPLLWLSVAWVAGTLWRVAWAGDWIAAYYRFDTHFTGLVLGAALYFYLPKLNLKPIHAAIACLVLAVQLVTANIEQAWMSIPIAEMAAVVLVGCLVTGSAGWLGMALELRPMIFIGQISYAMYLWHSPLAYYIREDWNYWPTFFAISAFAIAMATLSYFTVEALGRAVKANLRVARS